MTTSASAPVCFWCQQHCGGTCLGLTQSTQMDVSDPAYFLLSDGRTSSSTIKRQGCYICEDPEFAQMGLPLCQPCAACTQKAGSPAGHIPADDSVCDDCGNGESQEPPYTGTDPEDQG